MEHLQRATHAQSRLPYASACDFRSSVADGARRQVLARPHLQLPYKFKLVSMYQVDQAGNQGADLQNEKASWLHLTNKQVLAHFLPSEFEGSHALGGGGDSLWS